MDQAPHYVIVISRIIKPSQLDTISKVSMSKPSLNNVFVRSAYPNSSYMAVKRSDESWPFEIKEDYCISETSYSQIVFNLSCTLCYIRVG